MTNLKSKTMDTTDPAPIRIGVSACLLGEKVRFDGHHKLDRYIRDTLGDYFELVPVCPEVAVGLGVPRPTIQLEGEPLRPRAVGVIDKSIDVTGPLERYGRRMTRELAPLAGYLFKARSPSCGMTGVKIHQQRGRPKAGRGVYARELLAAHPWLPAEEEDRLSDPVLRESFVERVFAYHRWQQLAAARITPARLQTFHSRHKLILLSHGAEHYRTLGRLVADIRRETIRTAAQDYLAGFMTALQRPATRKRHANVLQHLLGYLKRSLGRDDKEELLACIDDYRLCRLPLIVPLTLLRHHFRRHPDAYVAQQYYLEPHPAELMLRYCI